MIKIENEMTYGWEETIRGMRNPMNSWAKSDSKIYDGGVFELEVGPNDKSLMMRLAKNGPVHAKYRRMIAVYMDITAPLYWWKEFDKMGALCYGGLNRAALYYLKKYSGQNGGYER